MSKLFPVESDVPKTLEQERVTQIVKAWLKTCTVASFGVKRLQASYQVKEDFLVISLASPVLTFAYTLRAPAKFLDQEHSLEAIRSYFIQEEIKSLKEKRAVLAESMEKTEARIASLEWDLLEERTKGKDENNLPL